MALLPNFAKIIGKHFKLNKTLAMVKTFLRITFTHYIQPNELSRGRGLGALRAVRRPISLRCDEL